MELLKNIVVVDLTTVVLGPFLTQMMGDMGAEIIKVEPPSGDIYRQVHPQKSSGMGAGFLAINRNKKSISIDLKSTEGKEIIKKLIYKADVLVHNMRLSTMENLGLSFTEVAKINSNIIYCSCPGFGSGGPYSDRPAYDDIIQAISGFADINRDQDGHPRFVPTILTDKISGLYGLNAILAALIKRNQQAGSIQLEVPMYESMVSFLFNEHLQGQIYNPPIGTLGYKRILNKFRKPHQTKDGFIAIMPYSDQNWKDLWKILGKQIEPWLHNANERSKRISELYEKISQSLVKKNTDHWLTRLNMKNIPCARVQSLENLLKDEHLIETRLFQETDHPSEGKLMEIRNPLLINKAPLNRMDPAPRLGEHTLEILQSMDYNKEVIDHWINNKIVVADPVSKGSPS